MNLPRLYASYNRRYFGNRLPHEMLLVVFQKKAQPQGMLGRYVGPDGYIKERGGKRINGPLIMLRIDVRYEPVIEMSLLHEMNHADTGDMGHGPRWLKGMRRLARVGAFDRLW